MPAESQENSAVPIPKVGTLRTPQLGAHTAGSRPCSAPGRRLLARRALSTRSRAAIPFQAQGCHLRSDRDQDVGDTHDASIDAEISSWAGEGGFEKCFHQADAGPSRPGLDGPLSRRPLSWEGAVELRCVAREWPARRGALTDQTYSTLCQRQTTLEFKVLFPWKPDKSGMSTVSRRCCLGHSPAVCLACLHVPVLPSVPASVSWVRITSGSSLSGFPKALFGSTVNERHSLPHPSVQESMEKSPALVWQP
ncbi:uncharacterized protein LOC113926864 [Zalophus californianus]|uniref:Uncharacterized protein LOC113926864 n=1 Tax=Zalophus californianus TaxID=9704 RepID=A0A6J2DTN8_ZALCA|nr:uncharacterized protein LOC113926864 [Zalophus californianus]